MGQDIDLSAFHDYASARQQFLAAIGCTGSCRDPLAEFAEWIALKELGGELASSRVQKGYDLVSRDAKKVQVKYLANPDDKWRNEHCVRFEDDVDQYALVFFEELQLVAMIVFPRATLATVCQLLGKRHPLQEITLQFTKRNFRSIVDNHSKFAELGVLCFNYPVGATR